MNFTMTEMSIVKPRHASVVFSLSLNSFVCLHLLWLASQFTFVCAVYSFCNWINIINWIDITHYAILLKSISWFAIEIIIHKRINWMTDCIIPWPYLLCMNFEFWSISWDRNQFSSLFRVLHYAFYTALSLQPSPFTTYHLHSVSEIVFSNSLFSKINGRLFMNFHENCGLLEHMRFLVMFI